MNENDFINALKEAITRAGTQNKLAKQAGVSQGTISDYVNGRYSIGNMTIATLLRFFPNIHILFFGEEQKSEINEELKAKLNRIYDSMDTSGRVQLFSVVAASFPEAVKKILTELEEHNYG